MKFAWARFGWISSEPTTAVVYVPILALQGIEGKMFKPMALVVMLALGGSLVLAVTLMPVLCSYLLGGKIQEKAKIQRLHSHIANTRRDYLHKVTTTIRKNHAMIVIEDLKVASMSKSAEGTTSQPGRNVRAKSGQKSRR